MNLKVRPSDVLGSITNPKNTVPNKADSKSVKYNINGKSDEKAKKKFSDLESCAVEITSGRNKIYKIKAKRGGQFFNPLKAGQTYGLMLEDRTSNELMFQFREVNKKAFDHYVPFSAKRPDRLILSAEREG